MELPETDVEKAKRQVEDAHAEVESLLLEVIVARKRRASAYRIVQQFEEEEKTISEEVARLEKKLSGVRAYLMHVQDSRRRAKANQDEAERLIDAAAEKKQKAAAVLRVAVERVAELEQEEEERRRARARHIAAYEKKEAEDERQSADAAAAAEAAETAEAAEAAEAAEREAARARQLAAQREDDVAIVELRERAERQASLGAALGAVPDDGDEDEHPDEVLTSTPMLDLQQLDERALQALRGAQVVRRDIEVAEVESSAGTKTSSDRPSVATSKVTLFSTGHSRARAFTRDLDRRQLQSAVKHGSISETRGGKLRAEHAGTTVILLPDRKTVVSAWDEKSSARAKGKYVPPHFRSYTDN